MAKRRATTAEAASGKAVTAERAARLYRLLKLLGGGPRTRTFLTRQLRLDVRGFYRDLELLRSAGIDLPLQKGRYVIDEPVATAAARLPFPDPHLTLGEAMQLAKGRSPAHAKLKKQITAIVP
jgi:predicted DNA-binding transcriptional regulator YafY